MTKPKNILKGMRVNEISLVGDGDNPHADVLILKMRDATGVDVAVVKQRIDEAREAVATLAEIAAGGGNAGDAEVASAILKGSGMDIEQLNERLGEIETSLDTVTKAKDAAEAKVTELTEALAAVTKERDEAKAAAPVANDDEAVLKALPEPVRKRLENAEKVAKEATEAVEKERDERDLNGRITKAKDLGVVDPEGFGGLLNRVAKGKTTPEDEAALLEVIAKAKAVKDGESVLFERIGKANGSGTEGAAAEAQLNTAVDLIKKAKPNLTHEQAYDEAITANPALYDEVRKIRPVAA